MQEKIPTSISSFDTVILGGGVTGLVAALRLSSAGKRIALIEKSSTFGGLAQGFKGNGWEWPLEYAYHHLFASDSDFLSLAAELDIEMIFRSPSTSSLYEVDGAPKSYRVDTPLDLLRFPLLSIFDRVRFGFVLFLLKLSPFISQIYETQTLVEFMQKTVGDRAYQVMFGGMMKKKYGKYAEKILASFIWTRINKRSSSLGYPQGGFQHFVDVLVETLRKRGVVLYADKEIEAVERISGRFCTRMQGSDEPLTSSSVISTLPSPVTRRVCAVLLSSDESDRLSKLQYLWATTLILETDVPILDTTYWLSLCSDSIPGLVMVQHTNYMDTDKYANHHLLYIGNYVDDGDRLLSMSADETLRLYMPHLQKLHPAPFRVLQTYHFKAPYSQPIFDASFIKNKPTFATSTPGFIIANLDMTYPYDRGTNYAVRLGNEAAQHVLKLS
ncbi:MAG: FAD-dependent oxidoreductase [Candidatus Roizmanbacteria bacterium]